MGVVLGPDSGFLGPDSEFLCPDSGFLGLGSGFLGPDSEFLDPDSGFLGPDSGFLGPDSGFLGPDSGLLGPDSGFLGPDYGFLGPDYGFLGPDYGFLGPDYGFLGPDYGCRIPDPGFQISDSGVRIPDSGFRTPDSGLRIPDAGWGVNRLITHAMVITLSLAIATKLFLFNWVKKGNKSKDLERANHLALIDAGCLFVFNIVPVFMVIAFPFFNKHIDDVMPLCKTGGFAIEGYLVYRTLKRRSSVTSSKDGKPNLVLAGPCRQPANNQS
ncbi:unnamed protein product [Caenorhabditis nigoni]